MADLTYTEMWRLHLFNHAPYFQTTQIEGIAASVEGVEYLFVDDDRMMIFKVNEEVFRVPEDALHVATKWLTDKKAELRGKLSDIDAALKMLK